jgi:UDP-N-acetylglucosamine 4-epimerase
MKYRDILKKVAGERRTWLVTGVAGFIGSNLLEKLLNLGQRVVGIDNFSTGFRENLDDVRHSAGEEAWKRFRFIEGDIAELDYCLEACRGADYVLHQAALGSVPRSLEHPLDTNRSNVEGFLNMLVAAYKAGIQRFVYASSSSVYGDDPSLPKVENRTGKPLSPYAVSKQAGELYAGVFAGDYYGLECVGLRYFNVFGPRQNPEGAYAAVIPKWIGLLMRGQHCTIFGDGETSRDFCYVENVVQANLLAALVKEQTALNRVYNIGFGARTTLNELYRALRDDLAKRIPDIADLEPIYSDFRPGDIRHTAADISRARELLGYMPTHSLGLGLEEMLEWFARNPSY